MHFLIKIVQLINIIINYIYIKKMFIVFEKIIFNIYYILQKLETHFHFNIEDYIP